jgi:hypothetical protein
MHKNSVAALVTIILMAAAFVVPAQEQIAPEKVKEIRRMLDLTGLQKVMEQMRSQMIAKLSAEMKDVPSEFWTRFEKKLDMGGLMKKLIPLYDKYYTVADLRAVNAFYASETGQRLIATLPKITRESMEIGMEWGKSIGEEAEREARVELKKQGAEK